MRILTDAELEAIDKSTDILTVSLNFGEGLSTSKAISHAEYAEILKVQHEKFKGTTIASFLESLTKGYELRAKSEPEYRGLPETTFKVSDCGGCGCGSGTGLGYVEGHICWCC